MCVIAMPSFGVVIAMASFGVVIAMLGFGVVVAMTGFGVVVAMTGFGVVVAMIGFGVVVAMTGFGVVIAMTTAQTVLFVIRRMTAAQVVGRQLDAGRDVRAGDRSTRKSDLFKREWLDAQPFAARGCNHRMVERAFGKPCDKAGRRIDVKLGAVRQAGRMVGAGGKPSERKRANNQVDLHVTAAGLGSAKNSARKVRQNDQKCKAEDRGSI
jgi:hypothetical protein